LDREIRRVKGQLYLNSHIREDEELIAL